jgi:hypothetical protein
VNVQMAKVLLTDNSLFVTQVLLKSKILFVQLLQRFVYFKNV